MKRPPLKYSPKALLILFFLFVVTLHIGALFYDGEQKLPPYHADSWDYDNLAMSIAAGDGYSYNWDRPEWRGSFLLPGETSISFLPYSGAGHVSARRAPGYPYFLAALYSAFGRDFGAARAANVVLLGLALSLALVLANRIGGFPAAYLTAVAAVVDYDLWRYKIPLMSEPLAACLVTAFALAALNAPRGGRRADAAAGVLLGCCILVRFAVLLWLPVLATVYFFAIRAHNDRRKAIGHTAVVIGLALALFVPWAVRNCLLLGEFRPTGTQTGIDLGVGYSDEIFLTGGRWTPEILHRILPGIDRFGLGYREENALSDQGLKLARQWVAVNWQKIPRLMWLKLESLWIFDSNPIDWIFLALLPVGFIRFRNSPGRWTLAAPIIGNSLAVALTHNHDMGRFLIPLHPLLIVWAAIAIAGARGPATELANKRS